MLITQSVAENLYTLMFMVNLVSGLLLTTLGRDTTIAFSSSAISVAQTDPDMNHTVLSRDGNHKIFALPYTDRTRSVIEHSKP